MNDLSDLLHDAVADVEPTDRLDEIRSRTASPVRTDRPWLYAAGATVLATAATVAAFAVIGDDDGSEPLPSDRGQEDQSTLVAAYYLGDTPSGPRLFREFDEVASGDSLQSALDRIERPASDPDYRTPWTTTSFSSVTLGDDGIDVRLGDARIGDDLAVQQVVYTLQAAAGERLPVWFWRDGQRGDAPVTAAPQNDVLNPVSISDPAEGNAYAGSFTARGRANFAADAQVVWTITDAGDDEVRRGQVTGPSAPGGFDPWEAKIDLDSLAPGDYTFTIRHEPWAYASDSTDTRTITVR